MLRDLLRQLAQGLKRSLVWNVVTRAPLVERLVQPAPGRSGWVRIAVSGRAFLMPDHQWWPTFARDWEAETFSTYRALIRPGDTVVDVGAWIGATVMFACACRAGRILAIEPNPNCRPYLDALLDSPGLGATKLELCTTGVGAAVGEATFGNTDDGRISTRSGASLFGSGTRIRVAPLPDLLAQHGVERPDFVKIDIEGGEFLIASQIAALAAQPGIRILLSFHPPLLPPSVDRGALLAALDAFDLYDADLQPIGHATVAARIASDERRPGWGTIFGNYFEVTLVPKGEPLRRRRTARA